MLVVDGVDLLDDVDGAPDLTWLPAANSRPNVRVVLTTSGARAPVDEVLRRGWPVAELPPLTDDERRTFIATFLGRCAKGLDAVHVDRLADAPADRQRRSSCGPCSTSCASTATTSRSAHVIDRYLAAATVDDLLEQVLARYEADFERDRPGLVGDAFRALWAARRGLTEPELLRTARRRPRRRRRSPTPVWSPLFLAAEDGSGHPRPGCSGSPAELHAARSRIGTSPTRLHRVAAHRRLAGYFAADR